MKRDDFRRRFADLGNFVFKYFCYPMMEFLASASQYGTISYVLYQSVFESVCGFGRQALAEHKFGLNQPVKC